MAIKKKKGKAAEWDEESDEKPERVDEAEESEDRDEEPEAEDAADDDQAGNAPALRDNLPERAEEDAPDPREVDNLTDRIFAAVLSRYGWERRGDRIEHVGEERRRNR